jgi:hypothetical protein
VLFAGSKKAAIATWIEKYKVGWVLNSDTLSYVANELRELASSKYELEKMKQRCFEVYTSQFSKTITMGRWDKALREILNN